jgi:hypothetical protein
MSKTDEHYVSIFVNQNHDGSWVISSNLGMGKVYYFYCLYDALDSYFNTDVLDVLPDIEPHNVSVDIPFQLVDGGKEVTCLLGTKSTWFETLNHALDALEQDRYDFYAAEEWHSQSRKTKLEEATKDIISYMTHGKADERLYNLFQTEAVWLDDVQKDMISLIGASCVDTTYEDCHYIAQKLKEKLTDYYKQFNDDVDEVMIYVRDYIFEWSKI